MPHFLRVMWAALVLAVPLGAAAQDGTNTTAPATEFLPPTRGSVWQMESDNEQCRVWRNFGPAENPTVLRISANDQLHLIDVVIAGSTVPELRRARRVIVQIEPGVREIEQMGVGQRLDERADHLVRIGNIAWSFLRDASAVQDIRFTFPRGENITLRTAGLPDALRILWDCQRELLVPWGVPRDELDRVSFAPVPSNRFPYWIRASDYARPALARLGPMSGEAIVRYLVGIDGRVSDCTVVQTSGRDILDEATCYGVTYRGRYTPATDRNGQPMAMHVIRHEYWAFYGS